MTGRPDFFVQDAFESSSVVLRPGINFCNSTNPLGLSGLADIDQPPPIYAAKSGLSVNNDENNLVREI